jgi:Holliday junction DNA helicase RuvA
MIGSLHGILAEKHPDRALIDVSGVGYDVEIPASVFCTLPDVGGKVFLRIHTHVREDGIRLFGFHTGFDRKVFEALINVSGVGPKVALALLGPGDGQMLCHLILESRIGELTLIPGIGSKTAERLILELKDKLHKLLLRHQEDQHAHGGVVHSLHVSGGSAEVIAGISNTYPELTEQRRIFDDIASALVNLGYKEKQVGVSVEALKKTKNPEGSPWTLETGLREALRLLAFPGGKRPG